MATSLPTAEVDCRQLCVMPSVPASAKTARTWSSQLMADWGLPCDLRADAALGVSELVANAAVHGSCQVITCQIVLMPGRVRFDVRECLPVADSPVVPVVVRPDDQAERGRGLLLVEMLSLAWGWTPPKPRSGRCVWALFGEPQ